MKASGLDPELHDLVFTTVNGQPLDSFNVTKMFQRRLKSAGLRRQGFHDLRHCASSLLATQVIPAKTVSDFLGHDQISTTLDRYSHLFPEGQQLADAMDAALSEIG